jgi:hypothetical protein
MVATTAQLADGYWPSFPQSAMCSARWGGHRSRPGDLLEALLLTALQTVGKRAAVLHAARPQASPVIPGATAR